MIDDLQEYDSDDAWMRDHAVLPPVPTDLRDRTLRQTRGALRRRRWARRGLGAGVPVLMLAVVLGFMYPVPPQATHDGSPVDSPVAETSDGIPPGSIIIDLEDPEALPLALNRATPAQRLAILKAVGDSYLASNGDPGAALPYYRQYLNALPEAEQMTIDETDTWLLAQLRQSKQLEVRYAQSQ